MFFKRNQDKRQLLANALTGKEYKKAERIAGRGAKQVDEDAIFCLECLGYARFMRGDCEGAFRAYEDGSRLARKLKRPESDVLAVYAKEVREYGKRLIGAEQTDQLYLNTLNRFGTTGLFQRYRPKPPVIPSPAGAYTVPGMVSALKVPVKKTDKLVSEDKPGNIEVLQPGPLQEADLDTLVGESPKKDRRTTKHFNLLDPRYYYDPKEMRQPIHVPDADKDFDFYYGYEKIRVTPDTKIPEIGEASGFASRDEPVKEDTILQKDRRTTKHFNLLDPRYYYDPAAAKAAEPSLNECYTNVYGISNDEVISRYNEIISKNPAMGVEEAFRRAAGIEKNEFDSYRLDRAA